MRGSGLLLRAIAVWGCVMLSPWARATDLPNLSPEVLQVPAAVTGPPYSSVTVAWGVNNRGLGAATGAWYDQLFFSTNFVLDGADPLVGSWTESGPVASGGSYWRMNTVRVPVTKDESNNTLVVPVTLDVQNPDLVPVVQQVPTILSCSNNLSLTLMWGVTNQGTSEPVGPRFDRVYFSTQPVLEWWDKSVVVSELGSGPSAGGSVWWTNTVRLPAVESGTYYLLFTADADSQVAELSESNNLVVMPVTFNVQLPDLSPLALQVPTVVTGPPNPGLTLSWAVTNQGPGAASGPWYDWVYLSTNAVRDGTEVLVLQNQQNLTLAAGDSYSGTNRVRLPIVESGTYYLLFVTDAWHGCRESDESNNTLTVPVTFQAEPPELAPLAMLVANTDLAASNPTVTVVWAVTNQGPGLAEASGSWIDRVSISTNAVLDKSARVLCQSEGVTVAVGESYWQTNVVSLPNVQSGTYHLFLEIDPAHFLHESDVSNNIMAVPITLDVPSPDLIPVLLTAPSIVEGGRNPSVTVAWGVTNQGIASVRQESHWVDALYCSTDPVLDWWDSCIAASAEWGPVAAESCYWRTNTVQLPVTQSGTYYLIFKTDGDGNLYESDESNNMTSVPVRFELQLPDLVPVVPQVPAVVTGAANPNVTLVWGVTNQGAGTPGGYRSDRVYLSTDAVLDSGDQLVWSEFGSEPPAGSSIWWTNTVALPVIESGSYYLIFAADADHQVYESSEGNNLLVVPITCNVQLPDLIPLAVQVPTVVNGPTNPSVSLSWAVTNQGGGPAVGSWADRVYFSATPALDGTAVRLVNILREQPLVPGESYGSTNTVCLPVTQNGTYYLIFAADAKNALYESDEANNTAVVPVKYEFTPSDLGPLVQVAPSVLAAAPNPSVTLVWGGTNQGSVATSGAWHDQVYLSRAPQLDLQALPLCAESWQGTLAAGETYWHTNQVSLPLAASGPYYLLFVTDVAQELAESNKSNNVVAVPLSFDLLAPDLVPVVFSVPTVVTGPPNPNVTLLWGVTNTGAVETPSGRVDRVYFSTDAELDKADGCLISQLAVDPVAAGGNAGWTNSVRLPVIQSGSYYLIFQVDAENAAYELSKSNNQVVVPVTVVVQLPDLMPVVSPAPLKVTGPASPSVELAWGVTNQGVGPAVGPWSDRVYFSTNAVLDWTATRLVDSSREEPLAAGQCYWSTNTVPLPASESGTYYLIFAADAKNALYESDEVNNTVVVPVEVNVVNSSTISGGQILSDGSFQLAVSGASGTEYLLQASADLVNWQDVLRFTCVDSPTLVVDPTAKDFGLRFYRVAVPAKPN